MFPSFTNQQLPNKIAIIFQGALIFPVYFLVLHSFCRKSFRFIKAMILLLVLRIQVGFSQVPKAGISQNFYTRGLTKVIFQSMTLLMLHQLMT